MLVPGGFWQQIGVAWCFVDQNSTFKMYFSDWIRQIKKKYRGRPVEEDEERRRRGRRFSTDDKRKERLKFEG